MRRLLIILTTLVCLGTAGYAADTFSTDSGLHSTVQEEVMISQHNNTVTLTGVQPGTRISILNLLGQTYYNDIAYHNTHNIDISNYPKGIYLIKIGTKVERIRKY